MLCVQNLEVKSYAAMSIGGADDAVQQNKVIETPTDANKKASAERVS